MFGNLPLELLNETIGYIRQPSNLQALCLVSKTVSSVATQSLYRDLVLHMSYNKDALEYILKVLEAVSMCEGLRFVKTLKIGPMKPEMVELFDRLISRLRDHSLVDFKWDAGEPPLNSQLVYIWEHQRNIQSIHLVEVAGTIKSIQPWKGLKFPQKYVHISLELPLEDDILAKLDLSCLRALTVRSYCRSGLPSCISANMVHITNLELYHISFFEMDIQLDHINSLVSLGIYFCTGTSSVLSNFTNPNLKEFRVQFDWNAYEDGSLDEDFVAQFLSSTGFKDWRL